MKKIALTSLVAMFAVSAANAANIINDNPLYRPAAGHFYSITDLTTDTSFEDPTWAIGETFGYGISDAWDVSVGTSVGSLLDDANWNGISLGTTYRFLNDANWKADIIGGFNVANGWGGAVAPGEWYEEESSFYTWTLGVRGGYVAEDWTLAAHFNYSYLNAEGFNWGDEGVREYEVGVDGQYIITDSWNLVAGVSYETIDVPGADEMADGWTGRIGVNYNIDENMFVGVYAAHDLEFPDEAETQLGLKFGIDF
ncbi:MAG: TonB-dependent receptor [Rickettsiales bacterium]|jgi:hypothetical protein|nr:TonB-dependent receptor [Rickettsiales bacterium]